MKLLFDENLSPRLVNLLADIFPDSTHVLHASLEAVSHPVLWEYAHQNHCILISKAVVKISACFGTISAYLLFAL